MPPAPTDPGGPFVPADQPPALVPELEQAATSRGAGETLPTVTTTTAGEPAAGGATKPWLWAVPGLVAAGIGGVLALGGTGAPAGGAPPVGPQGGGYAGPGGGYAGPGGGAPPVGPQGGGYAGPTGGFAQAALGGAMSAGPPAAGPPVAPPDLKQLTWDWGGHVLGAATVAVSLLSAPISVPGVVVGVGVAAASELKRRYWPSKPQTANDMIGGNPYQAMQQAGNAGIGQQVRDAHGGAEVAQELGTANTSTTWAQSQQQVHQETGGQTQPRAEVQRDLLQ